MKHILLLAMSLLLSGCLGLNDVKAVPMPYKIKGKLMTPSADRAWVIFGLVAEGPGYGDSSPAFSVHADEYSLDRQNITGNCWRYNHMGANIPRIVGTHQYFAFDVKPGYYVPREPLSALKKHLVFEVPAGRIVYLGDFVWTGKATLDLRRDPGSIEAYFEGEVALAEMKEVLHHPTGIVCSP